jgi:RpiR family carbohydrate utilization transcriptional regulator
MNKINVQRVPHNCALRLQAVYGKLKTAEKKAADYILQYPDQIFDLSIVDFAERAGCSEATIVRLSKRIGYEGYPELKADFRADEQDSGLFDYQDLRVDDPPLEVMRKVFAAAAQAIVDTSSVIDQTAYQGALDALCGAGKIMFCGVGNAAVVSQEAYVRWCRIGFPAMTSPDPDIQLMQASQLTAGDVMVAVSYSGQTKTLLNAVAQAVGNGATIIAITNFPFSALAKRASFVLQTAVFSTYISGEIMSERLAQLCVIESLFINFLLKQEEKYIKQLNRSNESLKTNKT